MTTLKAADLRAYASRKWSATDRLSRRDRAQLPVAKKVELAIELYEATRRTKPSWPSIEDRQQDLESHHRLHGLLQRAAHVGRR